jgi:hypothetical protein
MIIRTTVLASVLCVAASTAFGQSKTERAYKDALNNLSHECSNCAVFYVISTICIEKSGKVGQDDIRRSKAAVDHFLTLATKFGQEAGLIDEALRARVELSQKDMMKAIANDCTNYSVLLNRYGEACKTLAENPTKAFKEYFQRALANP